MQTPVDNGSTQVSVSKYVIVLSFVATRVKMAYRQDVDQGRRPQTE